jgi:hypothetical protein
MQVLNWAWTFANTDQWVIKVVSIHETVSTSFLRFHFDFLNSLRGLCNFRVNSELSHSNLDAITYFQRPLFALHENFPYLTNLLVTDRFVHVYLPRSVAQLEREFRIVALADFKLEVIVLIDVDMIVFGQKAVLGLFVKVSWNGHTVKLLILEVWFQAACFED